MGDRVGRHDEREMAHVGIPGAVYSSLLSDLPVGSAAPRSAAAEPIHQAVASKALSADLLVRDSTTVSGTISFAQDPDTRPRAQAG